MLCNCKTWISQLYITYKPLGYKSLGINFFMVEADLPLSARGKILHIRNFNSKIFAVIFRKYPPGDTASKNR